MWLYFPLKRREFDGFSGFLTGSCEGAYLGVRNWAGFRQNAEKARIIAVLKKISAEPTSAHLAGSPK